MGVRGFFKAFRSITDEQKYPIIKEVHEKAKEANKRIDELKKSGIMSSALRNWQDGGGIAFGISNGSYQDYQSELWRINNFLRAKTSTVEGAKRVIDNMIKITGMPVGVDTLTEIQARNYFSLADKISDYYNMIGETAMALDYQQIWESINVAIKNDLATLNEVNQGVNDIAYMLDVLDAINSDINTSRLYDDSMAGMEAAKNAPTKTGFLRNVAGRAVGAIKSFFGKFFRK